MTGGVDELEAFIAALRLSFLTSSTVSGSPDGLRQGIAAFRETLRPRGPLATSSAPTEAYERKEDGIYNSGSDSFAQAGEPIDSTWSGSERIDVASLLTKKIELVSTEVREGTSQIRELIESVKELKSEVKDLRSTLAASGRVEGCEACSSSATPVKKAIKDCQSSRPTHEARADSSPEQNSGIVPSPLITSSATRPQSTTEADSAPSVLDPVGSPAASEPCLATEPPVLPPLPPSSTPRSVVVADPVEVTNVIPGDSICSSKPPLPVTASGLVFTEGDDPGLVPFSTNPEKPTCRAASLSTDEGRDTNTMECTSLVADDKDNVEAEGVYDSQNSGSTGSHAKSPVTVTSIEAHIPYHSEELKFVRGDKITILDSPNTPIGWMYGETTETRRGTFLARYVEEVLDSDDEYMSDDDDDGTGNHDVTNPRPRAPAIVMAMRDSAICAPPGELRFSRGNRITILDSPNTPEGWMYGEIVEKRRGIFPALYVTVDKD